MQEEIKMYAMQKMIEKPENQDIPPGSPPETPQPDLPPGISPDDPEQTPAEPPDIELPYDPPLEIPPGSPQEF
jgi:hypothetical protein